MMRIGIVAALFTGVAAFLAPHAQPVTRLQSSIGGWEQDYYSTVNVDPSQLDAAFLSANGAAIDAKVAAAVQGMSMDADTAKTKLVAEVGELGILNTDTKKLQAILAPPKKD